MALPFQQRPTSRFTNKQGLGIPIVTRYIPMPDYNIIDHWCIDLVQLKVKTILPYVNFTELTIVNWGEVQLEGELQRVFSNLFVIVVKYSILELSFWNN